ncbi:MAG: hypothetical protein WDO74_11405 [Pseudomonadota bacterium]
MARRVAPALLFLALEKLRRFGRSELGEFGNIGLSLSFAFGSVYFFSAEQGTVWYAAHVVGAALAAAYLLFALEAERPWLAGLALGLGLRHAHAFVVRRTAVRARSRTHVASALAAIAALVSDAGQRDRPAHVASQSASLRRSVRGRLSILGHRLAVPHRKWGLFGYHYLGKNLGVMLSSLPFWTPSARVPFQISAHGLALWITTPVYLWLLWPQRTAVPQRALWITVACVALPHVALSEHGLGPVRLPVLQRLRNLLVRAAGRRRLSLRATVQGPCCAAVLVNAFGAATFGRPQYAAYYFQDNTQRIVYQPD